MTEVKPTTWVSFDLETTGVNTAKDRIVEYCFIKQTEGEGLDKSEEKTAYVNPGISIPQGATDVHKITDEMVSKAHKFGIIAPHLIKWLDPKNNVIVGYNIINFDIPLLATEMERAGIMNHGLYEAKIIDVMVLYRKYRSHSLVAAVKDLLGKDISDDAHAAAVDVNATTDVMIDLMHKESYTLDDMIKESMPEDMVDFARKLKRNTDGDIVYAIGKPEVKGKKIKEDVGFGKWMLKSDFPPQTKKILTELLK